MKMRESLKLNLQHFGKKTAEQQLQEINERKTEIRSMLEGEEKVELDKLETELRELNEQQKDIETRSRLMKEAKEATQNGAEFRHIETFPGGEQGQEKRSGDITESVEYREAFMNHVLRGEKIPAELRAEGTTHTTDVGTVIPKTVLNQIIEKLTATGMILPLVTRTNFKGGLEIPTSSVKPVATWVAEGAGSPRQKKTTGSINFSYHKLRCAIATTLEVDVMALPIFESTFISNVVEAMTIATEQAIVSGDGIGKPKGILAETPETGQALKVREINYQALIDAEGALPIEYENGAVYVMTKKTFMAYQGMVDANGQPIARVTYGITGNQERTLLGRKVILTNYIDSFQSAAEDGVFAFLFNFKDYILNTNYAMTVKKYEDNETDDLVTKAIMIVDGKVADKSSLVTLAKTTTPIA